MPHDVIKDCMSFKVRTARSIIQDGNLAGLLGERCKAPDHSALIVEFRTSHIHTDNNETDSDNVCDNKRYKLRSIPYDFMSSDISRLALQAVITKIESARETQSEIDNIYATLCDAIITEMDNCIPLCDTSKRTRKRHKTQKPYWNDELMNLWSVMHAKEKIFLNFTGRSHTKTQLRLEFLASQKDFDKALRRYERAYKRTLCDNIENMSAENPNEFWEKIKHLGPRKCSEIPMETYDQDGNIITDETFVLNQWKTDFENLYKNDDGNSFDTQFHNDALSHKQFLEENMLDPLYESNRDLNQNISMQEIETIIRHTKNGKSSGIDNIPYEVLKFPSVFPVLRSLFQLIFDTSIIPSVWRKAIIYPILKDPSSDRRIPMNYRGISLLSCISKLYSALINNRLTTYLEENDLLSDEQNGFRSGRSCEDHVFTLNSIIRNNSTVFATFIDLKKAFDFIDRDMLLYKLLLNKIDGKIYESIKSIYANTTACVRINGKTSNWFSCKSGVKQGDNCSPTLFSIFVDDLVKEINELGLGINVGDETLSMLLYADDIVMVARNEQEMQILLDKLHDWCRRWRVLINTDKSKVMHFRTGRRERTEFQFKIGSNILELTEKYKYLGVIFTEKNDFTLNAENLARGGGRALGSIITKLRSLKDFGINTYEKLFNACVVPILDYHSSVWGFKDYNAIDCVQNRSLRYFLGVHRFAPKLAINGDVGWLPAKERRWYNMLRYWNRLINMDNSRICKKIFLSDYSICRNNWSSEVKHIMNKLGLIRNFDNLECCDIITSKPLLYSSYAEGWSEKILTVPKLRTYITFKTSYTAEKYVLMNLNRSERSILAQFRCGILPLRIETGRYIGEKPHERLCKVCLSGQVEDELHFLFKCFLYDDLRNHLHSNITDTDSFLILSDADKLKHLMNNYPRQIAKYLRNAFEKRKNFLYVNS